MFVLLGPRDETGGDILGFCRRYPVVKVKRQRLPKIFVSEDEVLDFGETRWRERLPYPIPEALVQPWVCLRGGIVDTMVTKHKTIICTPEGERLKSAFHNFYLHPWEATSIRAYMRARGVDFTVKEWFVEELTANSLAVVVNVVRGSLEKIADEYPHYRALMEKAQENTLALWRTGREWYQER